MKVIFLLIMSLFLTIGCGSNDKDSTPAPVPTEVDITTSELPKIIGNYISPNGKLKIYSDGRFILKSDHDVRWYKKNENHQRVFDSYADCNTTAAGTIQIISNQDKKYFKLKFNNFLLNSSALQNRGEQTNPAKEVCVRVKIFFASLMPIFFP